MASMSMGWMGWRAGSGWGCAVATAMMLVWGCGGDRGERQPFNSTFPGTATMTGGEQGTDGTEGDPDTGSDTEDSGNDGPKLDVGGNGETGIDTGDDECASVSETADVGLQPADIIFVVDNSGSMDAEAGFVQNNMNMFSTQIFLANIDAHVVLISAYPDASDAGVCINQPLGSGGCPGMDTNEPTFLHVDDSVGSNNALQKILDHYEAYSHVLRPTAAKHVVVVTDDDSDLSAGDFHAAFQALDPSHVGYRFHAIASPEDPVVACVAQTVCCPGLPLSAALSAEYIELTNLTGGVFGNLCLQDFQPVFDQLSTAVISGATLACEFDIPEPPEGEAFNKDEVNVEFIDGMGGTLEIGYVDDPAACGGVTDGWYYDDPSNPTKIIVCPQTCDKIQGFEMAEVAIKFQCPTIPAG